MDFGFSASVEPASLVGSSDGVARPERAGVPKPVRGLTTPEGGTGILMSSGDPGMIFSATPGIVIRFASF